MFDYIIFRCKLFREEWGRRRVSKKFDRQLAAANRIANAKKRYETIEPIENRARTEDKLFDDEVLLLHTRYLRATARRIIVPLEPWNGKESWEEGLTGSRHMTEKAISELRAAVRAEKKLSREAFLMWVPLFTTLTGLTGTGIGLLAVWFGFSSSK